MATIRSIYRYPIKGLSPEPLAHATLGRGEAVPGDRAYAIENGPSGFDPDRQRYLPKQNFLMLMRNERLAALRTAYDAESRRLTIDCPHLAGADGRTGISADLSTAEGRAAVERFFAAYCAAELRGPPKILHVEGHSFSDVARKVVSIINLASVAAIEDMVGAPVDPLRFRANLYVEGLPAWSELDLVGEHLAICPATPARNISNLSPPPLAGEGQRGGWRGQLAAVRLQVVERIVRCAATNVDPRTAMRDLNIPQTLMRHLGHADCGIYAEVVEGGDIATGDAIEVV
jgi:MOSC domain-containing protein